MEDFANCVLNKLGRMNGCDNLLLLPGEGDQAIGSDLLTLAKVNLLKKCLNLTGS